MRESGGTDLVEDALVLEVAQLGDVPLECELDLRAWVTSQWLLGRSARLAVHLLHRE